MTSQYSTLFNVFMEYNKISNLLHQHLHPYLPTLIHTHMYIYMYAQDIFRSKYFSLFEKCVITCDAGELGFGPPDPSSIHSPVVCPGRWTLRDCCLLRSSSSHFCWVQSVGDTNSKLREMERVVRSYLLPHLLLC